MVVEAKCRYSPAGCVGATKIVVNGSPKIKAVSTSHVERANLTMRMGMRRFTRLTNAFTKKIEMHMHAVSLHFMHYNFARIHKSLEVTPAIEAGIAAHVWSIEEIVRLVYPAGSEEARPVQGSRRVREAANSSWSCGFVWQCCGSACAKLCRYEAA